jgi:hypothetical protein
MDDVLNERAVAQSADGSWADEVSDEALEAAAMETAQKLMLSSYWSCPWGD